MLEARIIILLTFNCVFIECLISNLNVRKLDKKMVAQKRQDTLDMCRIFNAETEKLKYYQGPSKQEDVFKHRGSKIDIVKGRRNKRDTMNIVNPALNDEDSKRVEKIVDKIYDEMEEKGQLVAYKHSNYSHSNSKLATNTTGRRFYFAPAELLGPDENKTPSPTTDQEPEATTIDTKTPRFQHGIVPYFIDPKTYDSHLAALIVTVFDYIEKATCIRLQRLRERPTDVDSLRNVVWLYITNPTGVRQCVHSNDRTDIKGVQMIVFGYDCMTIGDISHEVMHVLGFSHEHIRPDRDQFITILWDNIKPGYKKYFEVINEPTGDNLPYDYASVLHYPSRAFSRNGQVTILTEPSIKIGQREGLSELDIEKISMLYSSECMKRNREYLLKTCPTVVKAVPTQKRASLEEITNYFEERLWPYGIVNFKLRDKIEFSAEERENIYAVIRHIEKETCIEFRDLTADSEAASAETRADSQEQPETVQHAPLPPSSEFEDLSNPKNRFENITDAEENAQSEETLAASDNEIEQPDFDNTNIERQTTNSSKNNKNNIKTKLSNKVLHPKSRLRMNRSAMAASRRHASNILMLARSPEPGCICPKPGKPSGIQVLKINSDCFNSVNDLLHLFVHVLGLDHQHNMHDRDSFLHVVWDQLTPDIRAEMEEKLPPAASAGFSYDYQSVMHYPWLQIKDGRTNIMYPIWNDGWAMGHWQGLSSIDVQKLNLLYFNQCTERRRHVVETEEPLKS